MTHYYNRFQAGEDRKEYETLMRGYLKGFSLSYDRLAGRGAPSDMPVCVDKNGAMDALKAEIGDCARCELHKTRTKLVFGVGNPCSDVMFVGEAPGEEEDLKGEPFVGRAGRLLDNILAAAGFSRQENVYIANVLKSRPPENKIGNHPDAIFACMPFLMRQIEIVSPKVICCLGAVAAHALLKTNEPITKMRGRFYEFGKSKILPTYHPSYLLRNPIAKRDVWDDMKKLKKMLFVLKEEENV